MPTQPTQYHTARRTDSTKRLLSRSMSAMAKSSGEGMA